MKLTVGRPVDKKFSISSPFGVERTIKGKKGIHEGIDFKCPVGTPIRAVADGKIIRCGWEDPENPLKGYGLRVYQRIKLGENFYYTIYAHLSQILTTEDDYVKEGEVICLSGNSGSSTGPHLHHGTRLENTKVFFDMEYYDMKPKSEVA